MSSSTINSSLTRSRSLRSNSLKPSSLNHQPAAPAAPGPSNLTLFLTNLRLLKLDLRVDWPHITAVAFSTSARQESQKTRIHCVEWALYQLFALWDPEETHNKLQPFFPALEPLQSLNLRAALFRCLDQAKKNGVLGRDTVLRKTMLDECKGDRLEEVLAVFSNAVLKKVLQERGSDNHDAVARQLAYENFSYAGERSVLSVLILAHKASLRNHLRAKSESSAKYRDFSNLLDLNDRRIVRRQEQLKEVINGQDPQERLTSREARALQDHAHRNWSRSDDWLETILCGDSRPGQDSLLSTSFERVWKHVENNSIGDVEGRQGFGLLEQLNARVQDQENRLARWQDFGRSLSKIMPGSPSKKDPKVKASKIDLGFNRHENLQIGRTTAEVVENTSATSLDEYSRLVENMRTELSNVGKPQARNLRRPRPILHPEQPLPFVSSPPASKADSPAGKVEEWSSASETDEPSLDFNVTKSTSQTPQSEGPPSQFKSKEIVSEPPVKTNMAPPSPKATTKSGRELRSRSTREPVRVYQKERLPSPKPLAQTPPPCDVPKPQDSEPDLADQILNSMSAASPSPSKKQRHTLSLAERTRLSMSRASHSQYSDLHDDVDNLAELPRLSIRPKPVPRASSSASSQEDKHADLIERTRKSMVGFEAAQKKAHLERRRSIKDAKKKQRESSYFPRLEEEETTTPGTDKQELMEGDPDYESVFKSRPKIKTSPAVSPTRTCGDENELGD